MSSVLCRSCKKRVRTRCFAPLNGSFTRNPQPADRPARGRGAGPGPGRGAPRAGAAAMPQRSGKGVRIAQETRSPRGQGGKTLCGAPLIRRGRSRGLTASRGGVMVSANAEETTWTSSVWWLRQSRVRSRTPRRLWRRLRIGMTHADVETLMCAEGTRRAAIDGPRGRLTSYEWYCVDGRRVTCNFLDGALDRWEVQDPPSHNSG